MTAHRLLPQTMLGAVAWFGWLGLWSAADAAAGGGRWGVLIGVDDYLQAQDLKYCGADQQALRDHLMACGFPKEQVFLLHNKAEDSKYLPLKANIERQLDLVLGLLEKDDVVVLSFSGHGVHWSGSNYLCPADAELENPATLVSLNAVYDRLRECRASLKLLFVDACRNDPHLGGQGTLAPTERTRQFVRSLQEKRLPAGVVLFNSCAPGEISWDEDDFGHGVFMQFLLEAMKGQADTDGDGKVSLGELADYAGDKTKAYVARKFNDSQRPFLRGEYELGALDFATGRPVATGARASMDLRPSRPSDPVAPAPAKAEDAQRSGQAITNSIGMKLVLIPDGEFLMGGGEPADAVAKAFNVEAANCADEHPQHRVRLTKPFYLGMYEVTVGQFRRFVDGESYQTEAERDGEGGYGYNNTTGMFEGRKPQYTWRYVGWTQSDDHPVVNVSWNDAAAFCRWLSTKEGKTYRLPTEAEWEYACRAGTTTRYYSGDDPEKLASVGNVADATLRRRFPVDRAIKSNDGQAFSAPVGQYRPNPFGLYDMHGNVWEWCQDWYDEHYYAGSPSEDPQGASSGDFRVFRGGGWSRIPVLCRSSYRRGGSPMVRNYDDGFRVARAAP